MPYPLLQRFLCAIFLIAASALSTPSSAQISLKTSAPAGSSVHTPHTRAELVAHAPEGLGPGKVLWLGLLLEHQSGWHSYWKNPGDSGLPTQLSWQLPAGLQAGDIAWPTPHRLPLGTLMNYGYEGRVLLPVPVQVTPGFAPGAQAQEVTLQLNASWLICRKECIPESGQFTLQLPLEGSTALHASAFAAAHQAQPQALAAHGENQLRIEDDALVLRIANLPAALQGQEVHVFPETAQMLDHAARPQQQWQGTVWSARLPLSPERSASPPALPLVLQHGNAAWHVDLPVQGTWPAVRPAASISPALAAALAANALQAATAPSTPPAPNPAPAPLGLWLGALAAALLGGLLLNLMPCVFPVLAIKISGFAHHAQDTRAHRAHGLAYTAGVLLSFMALGTLMLALRAAGQAVGWGFQLQSPAVVAGLALLFTFIGLNLAGLYEFGHMLPSTLAGLQLRHPLLDAFFTGVLAVAVASPCTAPFMGASLGLTATLPAGQALGIFAALGLGLALPYLLASSVPAFAHALPRPGAWMQTLRRFLAFPMFATVVWLVWVLGQQSGIDGAAALLALLVLLALSAWALTLRGPARALIAPLSIAASAWWLWAGGEKIIELQAPGTARTPAAPTLDSAGTAWQAWEPGLPERLLQTGRPVFIDYTAAWCITCQYNKKNALADSAVLQDFAAKNVALLRADWTRRDPDISADLTRLGRSGVPVYVLLAPGRAPQVLTEILSRAEVHAALAKL